MDCKILYIFLEGDDDERFFQKVLLPRLREKYDHIKVIKYAQKPKRFEYIKKFIRAIQGIGNYIYVTDINNSPCVTAKKQEIQNELRNIDSDKILVVVREIESWYLAGLSNDASKKLGIPIFNTTDSVTKEQFNSLIPRKFNSRIDFMIEVLKNFSIEVAKQKNRSFRYCIEKYNCRACRNVSTALYRY
jgi:preprotein translocase subunit Sss1